MPRRKSSGTFETVLSSGLFVCLALAVGVWLVWDGLAVPLVTYAAFADYWEHTAVLTEWVRNFPAPGNPHVDSADLSSRYMPYFWVLAQLGRMLDLSSVQLMSISLVFNYCLIVVGLWLFLRSYFRDDWAPAFGFIAIFMLWGVGWNWSNLYQLRSFFYIGGYPSSFVFGLSLISFWVSMKLLRNEGSSIVLGAALAVLAALMVLGHPLTAVFGIVGCGLLALTESRVPVLLRLTALVALLAGTLLAEFWPYFSVWKLMLGQYGTGAEQWGSILELSPAERFKTGVWKHVFYDPVIVIRMLGPALLGIPVLFWLLIRRQRMFIVSGAIVMAIPYFTHLLLEIPLAHRFLLFVVTYLHLALVWLGLTLLTVWRAEPRPAYSGVALTGFAVITTAVIAGNFALLVGDYQGRSLAPETLQFRDKRAVLPAGQNVIDVYSELTAPLAEDAIVLTTAALGWPLPTVKGKVVSLYHENPMLLDQAERFEATGDFFYRPIDELKRAEIVTRYGASHVLLSDRDANIRAEVSEWLSRYSSLVSTVGSYRMYALLETVPRIEAEPPAEQPAIDPNTAAGSDPVPDATSAAEDAARPAARIRTEFVPPDVVAPGSETESETARSFGAPILAPIINVPDEVSPDADTSVVSPDLSQQPPAETVPAVPPSLGQAPAEPAQADGDSAFGAPVAEPIIEVPAEAPDVLPPGEPDNLSAE